MATVSEGCINGKIYKCEGCYFLLPKLPSKVNVCLLEIVNSSKIKSSSKQHSAIVHQCERVKGNYREVEGKRNKARGKDNVERLKMLQNHLH